MIRDSSTLTPASLKAMLELHIEQGSILESRNARIGVVEAIVGIKQMVVTIEGSADHAGTTPMNLRRDAMQGAARIIAAVETVGRQEGGGGVATVGQILCEPGQAHVIPGLVRFSVDVRHSDESRLEAMTAGVAYMAENVSKARSLHCHIEVKAEAELVRMSPEICDLIGKVAREKGVEPVRMASGAGHDTGNRGWQRRLLIESRSSRTAALWNPWIDKAQRLTQFAEEACQRMLCIETANVWDDCLELAPGTRHSLDLCLWSEALGSST